MKSKFILAAMFGVSLFVSGCYEEKDTVTVYPDGSGVIHLYKKLGEGFSQMATSNGTKQNLQASLDKDFYKDLALWTGVTAWTGCKASVEDKLVVNDATGYFDDISKLNRSEGTGVQSFSWTRNSDGGFTLSWSNLDSSNQNPLDQAASTPAQVQQMLAMAKGLKVEHEVVLPGAVTASTGAVSGGGRSASAQFTDKDLADYFTSVDDYRARVAKGAISKAQANSELGDKTKVMLMNMRVTCGPGGAPDDFAQFRKAFDAAKADYASAGTAQKIQDAKKG
jgi:hypothetical protein